MAKSNKSKNSNGQQGSGSNRANGKSGNRGASGKASGKAGNGNKGSNGKGNNSAGRAANGNDDRQPSRRRKGSRKKRVDPTAFWGDVEKLPEPSNDGAQITTNPSAVVQSLGRAPLAGQQNAADLYFAAVYDRSVNLAAALAAAGGLVEADELA